MTKNIKVTNTDDIPCFYHLFDLKANKDQKPDNISDALRRYGKTPYIYVHQSLKLLVEGEYKKSFRLIQHVGKIGSIFYSTESIQSENFRQTVNLMQFIIIHLTDEFKKL